MHPTDPGSIRCVDNPRAVMSWTAIFGIIGLVWSPAFSAPPTLSHLFPGGGQRGTKVVATCTGEHAWPIQIWAAGVEVVAGEEAGKLEITIPEDLASDRVWIRMYNAEGASNPVPFLIGGLKEISEQEPNNLPDKAQAITEINVTINGILHKDDDKGGDVDGFAVELMAGQMLVAAVDANLRLGSPMDAILQVVSPDGTVWAENHDDLGLDPQMAYTATRSGTHVVRLFAFPSSQGSKIAFGGGGNYIYRLTLTIGPFIRHTIPMSLSQAEPKEVKVFGWNTPPDMKLPVVPFGGTRLDDYQEFKASSDARISRQTRMGFAFAPGLAGAARVRLTPYPVHLVIAESDANSPMTLTAPSSVTGRIQAPRQTNTYILPLKKDQQIVIVAESQSMDLPLVPTIRLTDPGGSVAAKAGESGGAQDALITHKVAQDGDYQLTIGDRYRHGSDRHFYRLTIQLAEPDFELSAGADAVVVGPDKPAELPLTVKRHTSPSGTIGPITIEATNLPPGVTTPSVVSESEGDTASKVTLKFTTTGAAFSGLIRIRGTADEPRKIKRFARTPPRYATSVEAIWLTAIAKPDATN